MKPGVCCISRGFIMLIGRELLVRSTGFSRLLLIDVPPEGGTPNYRSRAPGSQCGFSRLLLIDVPPEGGTPNYRSRAPGSQCDFSRLLLVDVPLEGGTPN